MSSRNAPRTTPRIPTAERREQIAATALRMLAETSVDALTTRDLAAALDVTQPALFRHFANREALLVGVVEHARQELERLASPIVATEAPAIGRLRSLARAILVYAEDNPGLPRLLFSSATSPETSLRKAIRDVVAMQRAFAAELIRQGQAEGTLDPDLDPGLAATMFVGLIQGLVLRWELGERGDSLVDPLGTMFRMWLEGAAAKAGDATPRFNVRPAPRARATQAFETVDARRLLDEGRDPLAAVGTALERLAPGAVLTVEAPFRPKPLIALLEQRGHTVTVESLAADHWLVEVVVGGVTAIDDARALGLEAAEARVREALATLAPGAVYLARVGAFTSSLQRLVRGRGEVRERPGGGALVRVVG